MTAIVIACESSMPSSFFFPQKHGGFCDMDRHIKDPKTCTGVQ